jgi:hypothetical protein
VSFSAPKIVPTEGGAEQTFDVLISEQHDGESTITKHPVERGAPITDNVRALARKVTLVVGMTASAHPKRAESTTVQLDVPERTGLLATLGLATPIPDHASLLVATDENDPIQQAHDYLDFLRETATLVDVTTSRRVYTECLISKVSVPVESAGRVIMTIEFEKILTATSSTVAAPVPKVTSGAPPVSKGAQTPEPTPPANQPPQSVAAAIIG